MAETPLEALRSNRKATEDLSALIQQLPLALAHVLAAERHQRQQVQQRQAGTEKTRKPEEEEKGASQPREKQPKEEEPKGEPLFPRMPRLQEEADIEQRARWSLEGEQKSVAISQKMRELRPPSFERGLRRTAASLGGGPAQLVHQYDRFKEIFGGIREMFGAAFPKGKPLHERLAEADRPPPSGISGEERAGRQQRANDFWKRSAQARAAQQTKGLAGRLGTTPMAAPGRGSPAPKEPKSIGFSGVRAKIQAAHQRPPVSRTPQSGLAGRVGAALSQQPRPKIKPAPASLGVSGVRAGVFAAARQKTAAATAKSNRGFAGRVGAMLSQQRPLPKATAPLPPGGIGALFAHLPGRQSKPVAPTKSVLSPRGLAGRAAALLGPRPQPKNVSTATPRPAPSAPPSSRASPMLAPFLGAPAQAPAGPVSSSVAPFLRRAGAAVGRWAGGSRVGAVGASSGRDQNDTARKLDEAAQKLLEAAQKLEQASQGDETEEISNDTPREQFAGGWKGSEHAGSALPTETRAKSPAGSEKPGMSVNDMVQTGMDIAKVLAML